MQGLNLLRGFELPIGLCRPRIMRSKVRRHPPQTRLSAYSLAELSGEAGHHPLCTKLFVRSRVLDVRIQYAKTNVPVASLAGDGRFDANHPINIILVHGGRLSSGPFRRQLEMHSEIIKGRK